MKKRTVICAGGAMGIPISFLGLFEDKDEFYDTKIGSNVRIARHAMAIDEHRKDFEPTIWEKDDNYRPANLKLYDEENGWV